MLRKPGLTDYNLTIAQYSMKIGELKHGSKERELNIGGENMKKGRQPIKSKRKKARKRHAMPPKAKAWEKETYYSDKLLNLSLKMIEKLNIGGYEKQEAAKLLKNNQRAALILAKIKFNRQVKAKDVLEALDAGRNCIRKTMEKNNSAQAIAGLNASNQGFAILCSKMKELRNQPVPKRVHGLIEYALEKVIRKEIYSCYLKILLGSEAERFEKVMVRIQSSMKRKLGREISIKEALLVGKGTIH